MAKVHADGLELLGEGGVLTELTKRLLERALDEELTFELGYERGDPAGSGSGNSRNGTTAKRVLTEVGPVDLDVPRDRNGSFEPQIVPKGARRLERFNANIIALYSRGLSTRDIRRELKRMYGVEVSPDLISRVTDGIVDELREWQNRPLDAVYPIVYIDALVVKVRTQGMVTNRPAYLAIGVDVEGRKHVLGVWLGDGGEGAKFWLAVLTEIRNRGVGDVLFVCCDGLKGLPDAIEATWPQAVVQTCVVHLIRGSIRYLLMEGPQADRRRRCARSTPPPTPTPPPTRSTRSSSSTASATPASSPCGATRGSSSSPSSPTRPMIRKIIYTTNMIESVNYQLRKVTKTRGQFPDDDSALKLLRLVARDLSTNRGGVAGTGTHGWNEALNLFEIYFPNRLNLW